MSGLQDGDRVVARLIEVRDSLADEEGEAFLARLVLVLAAELDDAERVLQAIEEAAGAS